LVLFLLGLGRRGREAGREGCLKHIHMRVAKYDSTLFFKHESDSHMPHAFKLSFFFSLPGLHQRHGRVDERTSAQGKKYMILQIGSFWIFFQPGIFCLRLLAENHYQISCRCRRICFSSYFLFSWHRTNTLNRRSLFATPQIT